jgi:hypothetical protein
MLAELGDPVLVGTVDRGGTRYLVRGVATAERVAGVTAGLIDDQEVIVDLWIDPQTSLVTAAEFTTILEGGATDWLLELGGYGEDFEIEPPDIDG